MAAAVRGPNSRSERRDQLKMTAGRAVYGPRNVSTSPPHAEAKKPGAPPTRISGAASPSARENARMVPVRMPGAA